MKTDQDLKFHRGQEFTKKDDSHVHCIVQSYIENELAYLVTFTCSAHSKKISEADLSILYAPSTGSEKRSALERLNETSANHEDDLNENGVPLSPSSNKVKR